MSIPVSTQQARRIWIRAQRLDQEAPFGEGAEAVRRAVAHLGYVQIDTINVIERCHHHILWARIPGYRRADLRQAQSVGKTVFEFWTHALSYVPAEDLRFFLPAMKRYRAAPRNGPIDLAEVQRVVRMIRDGGPLSIRDFDDDVLIEKEHLWASRKPSKRALQQAFYAGLLTVSARSGMVKTYEAMDRHFGWDKRPAAATDRQVLDYALDRALRSQGIVSLDSICHLNAGAKARVRGLIEARVARGRLVPVALDSAGKVEHWAYPAALEALPEMDAVHLLSPFDPLIIQRRRLAMFFGYDHLFEAYVPKSKRLMGYFALPVLVGDEIVAAIDVKADRESRKLLLQQWTWVGEAVHKPRIEDALHRFSAFQFGD